MFYGYTHGHSFEREQQALTQAGAQEIVVEPGERYSSKHQHLQALIAKMKPHDVLIVADLSHLCRSLAELTERLTELRQRQLSLCCLEQALELKPSAASPLMEALEVLLRFEQDTHRQLTLIGQERARKNGRHVGRPKKFNDAFKRKAMRMLKEDGMSAAEVARAFKVHPSTIYRIKQEMTAS